MRQWKNEKSEHTWCSKTRKFLLTKTNGITRGHSKPHGTLTTNTTKEDFRTLLTTRFTSHRKHVNIANILKCTHLKHKNLYHIIIIITDNTVISCFRWVYSSNGGQWYTLKSCKFFILSQSTTNKKLKTNTTEINKPFSLTRYTRYKPLYLHTFPELDTSYNWRDRANSNRYLLQGRRSFNIPYDEFATTYLKINIRKQMIRLSQNFNRDFLQQYRYIKTIIIVSVIEFRVMKLKATFQAKTHVTYLAATHRSSFVCVFSTQHTSSEDFVFECCVPLVSENVFQSAMKLCCMKQVAR